MLLQRHKPATVQPDLVVSRHSTKNGPTSSMGEKKFLWRSFRMATIGMFMVGTSSIWLWRRDYLEHLRFLKTTTRTAGTLKTRATSKSDSGSAANANTTIHNSLFPPACSKDQLETIQHQLPAELCTKTADQPWSRGGQCSFSFATRCPDAVWLREYLRQQHRQRVSDNEQQQALSPSFTSIYVGCNKGMDAINTLRMGSANATYDKDTWRNELFAGQHPNEIAAGHCSQEFETQFEIDADPDVVPVNSNAVVHCIEPLPRNSDRLTATAEKLQFQNNFKVHAVAMSNRDGTAYFPATTRMGDEQQSIDSCNHNNKGCRAVPMYKLDMFMEHVLKDDKSMIDFLSIDVEGYDNLVLQGGILTLARTKYLEFEYNWKGPWAHASLSTTIETLKALGFACYWAGSHRNIWRISDCWLDHYAIKFWSNVACVNVQDEHSRELSRVMEQMFEETLLQGGAIQYNQFASAKTDGRRASFQ